MKIKEIIDRIKCKLFVCCRVTCNEIEEKLEEELEEELEEIEEYDYYTNKKKQFKNNIKKKRSSSV